MHIVVIDGVKPALRQEGIPFPSSAFYRGSHQAHPYSDRTVPDKREDRETFRPTEGVTILSGEGTESGPGRQVPEQQEYQVQSEERPGSTESLDLQGLHEGGQQPS